MTSEKEKGGLKIKSVGVTQLEGETAQTQTRVFEGASALKDANRFLREISYHAPQSGGYYKTRVTINFVNGHNLESRHDVKFHNTDGTIMGHAVRWLSLFAKTTRLGTESERKKWSILAGKLKRKYKSEL